jgi:hypothetical protein
MATRIAYDGGPILALDSATVTGVAYGEPGADPKLETVKFGGRDFDDEFDIWSRAQVWLLRRILDERPALICIEGLVPQYDKTIQCGIYAVLGAIARTKGIPVLIAPIATWRKFCLGGGRMKGKIAKARAVELAAQLGWDPPDHNAAEASMQWLWACAQVAPRRAHRFEPLFLRRAG